MNQRERGKAKATKENQGRGKWDCDDFVFGPQGESATEDMRNSIEAHVYEVNEKAPGTLKPDEGCR